MEEEKYYWVDAEGYIISNPSEEEKPFLLLKTHDEVFPEPEEFLTMEEEIALMKAEKQSRYYQEMEAKKKFETDNYLKRMKNAWKFKPTKFPGWNPFNKKFNPDEFLAATHAANERKKKDERIRELLNKSFFHN